MAQKLKVQFAAEIKQVGVKKLASLDKSYKIVLVTDSQSALLLDNFASDILVDVTVEPQSYN